MEKLLSFLPLLYSLFPKLESELVKSMHNARCILKKNPRDLSLLPKISPKPGKVHVDGPNHPKENRNFNLHNHFTRFP